MTVYNNGRKYKETEAKCNRHFSIGIGIFKRENLSILEKFSSNKLLSFGTKSIDVKYFSYLVGERYLVNFTIDVCI